MIANHPIRVAQPIMFTLGVDVSLFINTWRLVSRNTKFANCQRHRCILTDIAWRIQALWPVWQQQPVPPSGTGWYGCLGSSSRRDCWRYSTLPKTWKFPDLRRGLQILSLRTTTLFRSKTLSNIACTGQRSISCCYGLRSECCLFNEWRSFYCADRKENLSDEIVHIVVQDYSGSCAALDKNIIANLMKAKIT